MNALTGHPSAVQSRYGASPEYRGPTSCSDPDSVLPAGLDKTRNDLHALALILFRNEWV